MDYDDTHYVDDVDNDEPNDDLSDRENNAELDNGEEYIDDLSDCENNAVNDDDDEPIP